VTTRLEQILRETKSRLRDPSPQATERALRAALAAYDAAHGRRRRGALVGLVAAAVVLVLGGIAIGLVAAPRGKSAAPSVVAAAGPGFLPAHGWNTVETGLLNGDRPAIALAATVPVLDAPQQAADPARTLAALPADGIVIVASIGWRGGVSAPGPVQPSLDRAQRVDGGRLVRYRLEQTSGGYELGVDVYFGSEPSAELLAEAQRELGRLTTPPITLETTARVTPLGGGAEPLELRGRVEGGRHDDIVRIEARDCGSSVYRLLFDTHIVDDDGNFRAVAGAAIRTDFRAEWKGAVSRPVTVLVRPIFRVEQESRRVFAVTAIALRYFRQARAQLQRFDRRRSRWVVVKTMSYTRAAPGGSFLQTGWLFRSVLPRGTQVRAVLPRTQTGPCYIGAVSNIVSVS
jgi:hypothetical protein